MHAGSKRFAGRSWALYIIQQESLRLPGSSRGPQTSYLTSDGVWFKPHCSFWTIQREIFFSPMLRWRAVSVLSALERSKTWMSERKKAINVSQSTLDWDVSGFQCRWLFFSSTTNECLCGNFQKHAELRLQIGDEWGPHYGPPYCPTKAKHRNYTKAKTVIELVFLLYCLHWAKPVCHLDRS